MFVKWPILLALAAVFGLLAWRRAGTLGWAIAWWLGLAVFLRWGFVTPIPASVQTIYMAIATLSILTWVSSDHERWRECYRPILALVLEPRRRVLLASLMLAFPALAAANVYLKLKVPLVAPSFARTVHPAPPDSITVAGNEIDLRFGDNPYRSLERDDPEKYREHLENGRRVFFENCFYCHGDAMGGDGPLAYGLNPIPTNFTDQGILPQFQESFLFWRVAKGGPGLPAEGGPWDSAMPAWERFLTEEEMWDAVMYLYEYTDYRPRAQVVHH